MVYIINTVAHNFQNIELFFLALKIFCVIDNTTVLCPLVCDRFFSSSFLLFFLFFQNTMYEVRRPRCLYCGRQLCFCSLLLLGGGASGKALCSRSPLFLSSCVLTSPPLSLPLSLSPSRTTHWVSTRSETAARQDLSAQPGPPTRSRQGTPISTSQPIKVSFATHM